MEQQKSTKQNKQTNENKIKNKQKNKRKWSVDARNVWIYSSKCYIKSLNFIKLNLFIDKFNLIKFKLLM